MTLLRRDKMVVQRVSMQTAMTLFFSRPFLFVFSGIIFTLVIKREREKQMKSYKVKKTAVSEKCE
ncbi:CLUMA_CG000513, isoform A [Clunio marinus]|uniref:CLUMA_CG000513, isoform A n=1 Tax=Clunio marinus TaxID=568069 RepID=A0A1J1HFB7_9DIPT|nr:CLUMA_CG000513, isoform A [Clunio marinus]